MRKTEEKGTYKAMCFGQFFFFMEKKKVSEKELGLKSYESIYIYTLFMKVILGCFMIIESSFVLKSN
jgi:hypothetical protein